ncbi:MULTISPECIES: TetR/AcrR family transcriptional regulator [Vibrio]|jgi:AcrR family transcriptional regulator|uniref:TetR family transcriptional regulator n=2 Tax=Vibrio cyclitrophicus TaxID=47951 RepID=A0A7Z1S0U8_9VIBR|nr:MULTISPECIES: TetR/AcrR family transcriptional regulator [Vibrio]KNH10693.1 TetR family transcriptional regulator [Vibrio lentus]KAA8603079.1 Transcriptional regulator AcrR family [Vibrio cyclitrophicus]MBE8558580.1 TetR/AcrR family transcriptional regulator [Vibrio sp. OPT24]MBE8603855.1 TetR/AcrR family transcriptional regulator [Vibrio sp. OPT10]MBU2931620.1 TetR/AcrR family transcriptional regulator [Vibrio cyclitrophicus]|tara:strand:+ start:221 stop:805 length:585 start_codon:yes stop_codon:yes gene_type:complete
MAKTAKFDRQDVVDKATNLYWEKGFHATSMRNLQDVIDMRPGSIYATFGSKEGLFKETLARYTELGILNLNRFRNETDSPIQALENFVRRVVVESKQSSPNGMCMLAKTVAELTDEHSELLEEAKKSLKIMEGEFAKVIAEAQELGEISKEREPAQLARHVQVQIAGLRTYAKTCDDIDLLNSMVEDVFKYHPF